MPDQTNDVITLPNALDVPGLVFRHFRGESDYPAIAAVGNASRLADGNETVMSAEDVAVEFAHLANSDPARDMIVAEIDGEAVGFTHGRWSPQVSGPTRYQFELTLAPAWRGHGIRRALLHWVEARLRQIAAEHPRDAEKAFATHTPEQATDLTALLHSEGYLPVRYYNVMVRSLEGPLPDFPMPPGLELRPVLPEHYRPIWDASQEAFRDHWGKTVYPEEMYQRYLADPVTFKPELWQIAWDIEKNEVAGQVRTFIDELENDLLNRRRGFTESISVRRPYRRRGLARAMIAESLRVLKARGMTESALTSDSENITGAVRLYEECGFATTLRIIAYRKPLDLIP
ncbi:GNAT family N-acetyltransferase [Promineifilum sp.]|uniref:GNAT family N-acetyltransferase n=1 Tax=Promineifilum sp. TaxID=2664178 RepID=UPI0035ADCE19